MCWCAGSGDLTGGAKQILHVSEFWLRWKFCMHLEAIDRSGCSVPDVMNVGYTAR